MFRYDRGMPNIETRIHNLQPYPTRGSFNFEVSYGRTFTDDALRTVHKHSTKSMLTLVIKLQLKIITLTPIFGNKHAAHRNPRTYHKYEACV